MMSPDDLTFDSIAVFDEKTDSVKFANRFIDPTGVERLAISRVSREFLMALCDLTDASAEDLLEAYVSKCDEVNDIAARQFAAGEQTPFLGLEHFLRERGQDGRPNSKKRK